MDSVDECLERQKLGHGRSVRAHLVQRHQTLPTALGGGEPVEPTIGERIFQAFKRGGSAVYTGVYACKALESLCNLGLLMF